MAGPDRAGAEDCPGSAGAVPSVGGVGGAISGPPTSIIRLDAVDSTQTIAFALAAEGAADGSVVVADYQRAGRGRHGRTFLAPPGTALLTSIVVRPRRSAKDLPLYSLVAALATADAIERLAGVAPRLKWPNDVLLAGKKVAGILLESKVASNEHPVLVIGIGINLRQTSFPADLDGRATSLRIETGRDVSVDDALTALLDDFGRWRARLEREGPAPVRERWIAQSDTIGRRVEIDGVEGLAVDLGSDGSLVIADGHSRRRVLAGEIGWQSAPLAGVEPEPMERDAPRR